MKSRLGAVVAVSLLLAPAAAQTSKFDARLRVQRRATGGGYSPLGVGPAAAGPTRSVLIRVAPGTAIAALRAAFPTADFGSQAGDIVTASADDAALNALVLDSRVQAVEHAVITQPTMDAVRSSASYSGTALGTIYGTAATDLIGTTGAGVVVGVVDTGIDFKHLDFVNDGASTSRLLEMWDQTDAVGPTPASLGYGAGFSYGTNWTRAQMSSDILNATSVVRERDTDGHGTHVTGIAAGDGTGTNGVLPSGTFKGMAPAADIIVVKTTFNTANVIDGVSYIINRAAAAGKRAVINLSLGTQYGPHDGTSAFESALGALAAGTPVVVAMGNDGASSPHAGLNIGAGGSAGVLVLKNAATTAADIEFWHPGGDGYTVTVELSGIGGSLSAAAGTDQFGALDGHTVEIYNGTNTGHPLGDKLVYVYVARGAGIIAPSITITFARTFNGGTGRIDGWLSPSGENISFGSYVDNTRTLGEPACASNVFSVASYASKRYWDASDGFTYSYNDQSVLGQFSAFSSQGPTRDGRQVPEVAAPGDVIASSLSSDPAANPGAVFILTDAKHRILRGTSMAAPVVTGILAARIQAVSGRTVADLRAILRAQARTDSATGAIPNYAWGYGKTASSPQPTAAPSSLSATTMGPSSVTWNWGVVTGADSYSLYYSTNPSVRIASGVQPPYIHTGLAANTTTGVIIKGSGAGVDGPGAFISASSLAAPPTGLPTVTPHVDSVTVSWTPCPAAPATVSCEGYSLTASTAVNLSGALFTAQTLNRADSFLEVMGLQPLTQYYFVHATLNSFGAQTATGPVSATTLTNLLAPIAPQFSGTTTSSIRFDWNPGGNAAGLTYLAESSTSPAFSGVVLGSATKNDYAIFTGMAANASYYFRVQAVGGPSLVPAAPLPTLAIAPVLLTAPFSAVFQSGFAVGWSSAGNSANTLYLAEISAAASFSPLSASSSTRNLFASFTGLASNTLYYARAVAISHGAVTTAYTTFGSTLTFVLEPTLPPQPFSGQGPDGFTFSFNTGGNPAGTAYIVRVSTDPVFGMIEASVNTTGTSASFSGLNSNRRYYADVAALNLAGTATAYTGAVSTATTVVAPVPPATAVSARSAATLSTSWATATLALGTNFTVQASVLANFAGVAGTSTTVNAFATVSGLAANTVHFLRVRALSLNAPTPDGPWATIGSGSTLANAPAAAGAPFPLIGVASMTVAWTPLPLAPQSAACEGYLAELSASPAFTPILRSSVVAPGAGTANFSGLAYSTTYYTRVASLDWEGNPNYLVIGAARTSAPALTSGTVSSAGLTLFLSAAFAVAPSVSAEISEGTFPPGTVVTMLSGVTLDLRNPRSAVARLTALGNAVGVEISAGGLQPLKPVRLTISYDPLFLPAGSDPKRLMIARYGEPSALWTLVPSAVDFSGQRVIATVDHFSSFAPFFVTAGASLSDGVVFPQPWEVGDPAGAYGAQALTFANYPAGTTVRVMSLTGEQLWEGTAAATGVLTWDGRNSHGRNAASGTYYAIISGGGARKSRRVVIIR